jgi:PQQ-dependent dehydrogenase (methanol/ethanol family)
MKKLTQISLALAAMMVGTSALAAAACSPNAAPNSAAAQACAAEELKEHPKVGGNLGNQNYSVLKQINTGTVKQLGAAWQTNLEGGVTSGDNQSSPIVHKGVIFMETAQGKLHAVNGKTGEIKWTYNLGNTGTRRGPSIGEGKVFTIAGGNLVALDEETGAQVWRVQASPGGVYGTVQKVATVYADGMVYVGSNDGNIGTALAFDAKTGANKWHFYSTPRNGDDPTGAIATWGTNPVTAEACARAGGAAPWMHPAIDLELGMVYYTFGNARSCGSSQSGATRPGTNLYSSSIVALDLKTGEYKWHFQSVHHGIWDQDNVMAPVFADVKIKGKDRKVLAYGSKSGLYFILDRKTGEAPLGVTERPVPQDARQLTWPTQPYPDQGGYLEQCVTPPDLGGPIPGDPNRAVPNYEMGCQYAAFWSQTTERPILTTPSHNGGANWGAQAFSPSTGYFYTGYAVSPAAHYTEAGSNGQRAVGQYQSGGVVAVDASTNKVAWRVAQPYDLAHGNGFLATAGDVGFIGMPDGNFLALNARDGKELWRFQTGAGISASPISYEIDGEQYVAIYAGGTGIPYGNLVTRGDKLWAFKIGGTVAQAAAPAKFDTRRPVSATQVEGSTVNNTVLLARTAATGGTVDAVSATAMYPNNMRVPVGTTVTFTNPVGNRVEHCATQFFEGLFNPKLQPGESFQYTFTKPGEYFYNDCANPIPTGKVVVY